MNKILIAVDDTKSSKEIFSKCTQICKCMAPGVDYPVVCRKVWQAALSWTKCSEKQNLATLREVLEGTEYKEAMDRKS